MKIIINTEEFSFSTASDLNTTLNCIGMVKSGMKGFVKMIDENGQTKTFNKFALDNSKILVTLQNNKTLWKKFISWLKKIPQQLKK